MPQDVQAEAFDFPEEFFRKRVWTIPRTRCDQNLLRRAAEWIRAAKKPSDCGRGRRALFRSVGSACRSLRKRQEFPSVETQAGKGALPFDHPQEVGAIGVTGTPGANILAREADLILGIGTRYGDFTTASKTAFQNPGVRFININVAEFDAFKHAALPLTGDARVTLEELQQAVAGYKVDETYARPNLGFRADWEKEVDRIYSLRKDPPIAQGEVIGVVNNFMRAYGHCGLRRREFARRLAQAVAHAPTKGYHLEYGYSCMGYEIAGGLGVKMADPDPRSLRARRRRFVLDDGAGNRHVSPGGLQTQHRAAGQPWLFEHRGTQPGVRQRRDGYRVSLSPRREIRWRAHAGGLRGERGEPGRVGGSSSDR